MLTDLRLSGLNRLSYVDRATGEPVRRYEHPHPGSLVHVDVKKIGMKRPGFGSDSSEGESDHAQEVRPAVA